MTAHQTAQHRIHELQHTNKLGENSIQAFLTLLRGNSAYHMALLTKQKLWTSRVNKFLGCYLREPDHTVK